MAGIASPGHAGQATTPIEHLIVVIGENLSFDGLFATFEPPAGQRVANLLSKGIVDPDGRPGPHFTAAAQRQAEVREHYEVTPRIAGTYAALPQPSTTYAAGQPRFVADRRFPPALPNGPFQITRHAGYLAHIGDPVHRFFQMWQQFDGGRNDLFVWVDMTSGEGSQRPEDPFSDTNQGGVAMGFYNMAQGDAPYFRELARSFALADNYHQPIMGGTGVNFFALVTGHVAAYLVDDRPAVPPANQIENPDPRPGTNNRYNQSGYQSGSYVNCADATQPGATAIRDYLASLPYKVFNGGNCAAGHYYLVNNYRPGYAPNGERRRLGPDRFVAPPQLAPTVAAALTAKGVSWKWYSGGRSEAGLLSRQYSSLGDPLTYFSAIMTGPLRQNLQTYAAFERDLADERNLPAVSFITPANSESGHPAYSTVARFEDFVRELVGKVRAHPAVWSKAAILLTTDEGGGYYDSGYIQILDFFGDGTRIPLLVVSPFARKGVVDHTYYDHVSILKFIERNWGLAPLSSVSRDNLPNPVENRVDPYVPANRPAIGDLMNLFQFR